MSSSKYKRGKIFLSITLILISVFLFVLGYYLLYHVSIMENPFLGNTFHIILGCVLMAISILLFIITIKKQFFIKKRNKSHQVFLKDQKKSF